MFEVPGAGGFLLSEWAPGLDRFYDLGGEIDVFRSKADLIAKVGYYLAHPGGEMNVPARAYDRTVKEHIYDFRMGALVKFAIEQHQKTPIGTGVIDWAAFDVAASGHTVTHPR